MTSPNRQAKAAGGTSDEVSQPGWIEIFRAGTHTDMHGREMEFTDAHLAEIAGAYDPGQHAAPVVVGHPKHNHPAYGWVAQLKHIPGALVDGVMQAGRLLYQEQDTDPAFSEMRKAGRFRKRSASFYLPDSPGNPTPGKMALRHVGFLGAMPPAIKGLKDFEFADDGTGVVEFADEYRMSWGFRALSELVGRLRDRMIETDGLEVADRVIPAYTIESLRDAGLLPEIKQPQHAIGYAEGDEADATHDNDQPSPEELQAMSQQKDELDARAADLEKQKEELDARQREFDERARTESRTDATHFADQLVNAGKLPPARRAAVIELLIAADAAPALNFGEGDAAEEQPAGQLLRELLSGQPAGFDFSEKSAEGATAPAAVDFAAPAGAAIDADRLAIHNKATAYQAAHPGLSYAEAVKAVGG